MPATAKDIENAANRMNQIQRKTADQVEDMRKAHSDLSAYLDRMSKLAKGGPTPDFLKANAKALTKLSRISKMQGKLTKLQSDTEKAGKDLEKATK